MSAADASKPPRELVPGHISRERVLESLRKVADEYRVRAERHMHEGGELLLAGSWDDGTMMVREGERLLSISRHFLDYAFFVLHGRSMAWDADTGEWLP